MVALIRVITSPPKGCCLLSIDATASRGAGREVEQGGHDGRRAEIERDGVAPVGGVAGLDVDEHVVDDHRGDLEVGLAQHRRQPPQRVQVDAQLEVVDRGEQRWQVGALVGERRLGQLDVALLDGRTQDHLAADADGGRLRPGDQRRHVDSQVARSPGQAGQPPAVARAGRRERAYVEGVTGHGSPSRTRTLHFLQVPWPPQVESIAMPFQLAASKTLTPGGTRTSRRRGAQPHPAAVVAAVSAPAVGVRTGPSRRSSSEPTRAASPGRRPSRHRWRRPASCPVGGDPAAPHSSWPSSRSAALTASTICGVRASMIALVSPRSSPSAGTPRRGVPVGHAEGDVGRAERHVEAELVADPPDRLERGLDDVGCPPRPASPRGRSRCPRAARPYSDGATSRILRVRSSRLSASIGISSSSLGSATIGGAVLLDQRQDRGHPVVLGGDRVDQRPALVGRPGRPRAPRRPRSRCRSAGR